MVVDDDVDLIEIMSDIIQGEGYSVVARAVNGDDAIECYKRYRPKLIIMDVIMPRKDGIEAAREILNINRNARIIMCSSIHPDDLVDVAKNVGAWGVLSKPYASEQVREILESVLHDYQ
jgi:two-component system chemotaxis response regulator CheY